MITPSLEKLRQKIQAENLDAFLVTQMENRRYLSGFSGSSGALLITADRQIILTDSRYYQQVGQEAPEWELAEAGYDWPGYLAENLAGFGLHQAKIGFEAEAVSVAAFNKWREVLTDVTLRETSGLVMALRVSKTADELTAIRKAVALADRAMAHIYQWIQPGMTEKQVAWELEVFMRAQGASALSFETIVAFGPNTALPHATPTDRACQLGDVALIDMGCVVDGYCSDITRTFSLGEPADSRFMEIWRLVFNANAVAAAAISAGTTSLAADAYARDIIKAAGYGDYFGHGLGHGVGLAVHEAPKVSYTSEDAIPVGAVITIEPGVYLPGDFGARLEDMALVTENGLEILTGVPKIDILFR
ncbi:MAG TPA: aminopeptidase P family protein [Chloroflexi bacterium]|nr:aminopeptidase P family protein [Chloroflexota bacterium]